MKCSLRLKRKPGTTVVTTESETWSCQPKGTWAELTAQKAGLRDIRYFLFFRFCCKTLMETSSTGKTSWITYVALAVSHCFSNYHLCFFASTSHCILWLEFHGIANLAHVRLPRFWKIDRPPVVLKHQIGNILQPCCGTEYIVKICWNFQ